MYRDTDCVVSDWDVARVERMQAELQASLAHRVAAFGQWHWDCDARLTELMARLRPPQALDAQIAPAGLAITLRPYQQQGLAWLQHLRQAGLAGILLTTWA